MAIDYNKRPKAGADGGGQGTAAGGVSLSKITLTKSAPSVSLTKRGSAGGQLRVNLQWSAGEQQSRGLFGKRRGNAIDLKQTIGVTEGLRSGTYSKTLTFTLSTTTP